MTTIIVDNSALIPLFFDEDGTRAAQELFSSEDHHCIAPDFLVIEFSNVLAQLEGAALATHDEKRHAQARNEGVELYLL